MKNIGLKAYQHCQEVEELANKLGFKFTFGQYGYGDQDYIVLANKDDCLPIYAKDTSLFSAFDIDEVHAFLKGIMWARDYDRMLKVSDQRRREQREQSVKNHTLLNYIKHTEFNKED